MGADDLNGFTFVPIRDLDVGGKTLLPLCDPL